MREIIRGIAIDNGGSEVRVTDGDCRMEDILTFTNDFVTIPESQFRVRDVDDIKALCRFKKAPKREYLGIIARGLTGKQYNGDSLDITSQDSKVGNVNYYRQFLYSIARDAIDIYLAENKPSVVKSGLFKKKEEVVYEPLHINSAIVVCIPIREHSGTKDKSAEFRADIAGDYVVEFPLLPGSPEVSFTINPKYIGFVPEGGVAVNIIRNRLKPDDYTVVIDVGHITTDIGIFKGTSLYGQVTTTHNAGSMLVSSVRSALDEEGYHLTPEQVQEVIKTGDVRVGIGAKNVQHIINTCNEKFVNNYLKKDLISCLTDNGLDVKNIQHVLALGAPMRASGKGSVKHTLIEAAGLQNAAIEALAIDARYINIKGASLYVKGLTDKVKDELQI